MLCLHFDDKLVKQMEEDLSITYCLENCCQCDIPDIGDNTSTLLGVVQAESSTGSDQAHVSRTCWIIMMLLTRYLPSVVTILAQAFSGAISVLKALNIFFKFSAVIISVRSTFPSSWKNSLAKYVRPNEVSLCPSAEGTAVLFTRCLLKIWNLEREPWL